MKSIFTTIAVAVITFSNLAKAQKANTQDSSALVQLYDSTNGPSWRTSKWLNGPVKHWEGVTLDANGKVIQLNLYQYNLSGKIPSSIGTLNELTLLNLSFNSLTGIIPSTIGNLKNLNDLELSINKLTGHIPLSIGNLVNLQILNLADNRLTGNIPDTTGSLNKLKWLYLFSNHLHGRIPSSLGNLSNLSLLYLDDNKLSGSIPSEIGALTKLEYLDFQKNHLSGNIPASFGNLSNLGYLYLLDNQLSGRIPESFGNLKNLNLLYLQNNLLEGNIPEEFGNLHNLIYLNLSRNNLSGAISTSINNKNNPQIIDIYIEKNSFTFRGLAELVTRFPNTVYVNQAQISLNYSGNIFSVTGGSYRGTNTYQWFNSSGNLVATKINDSTFQPAVAGSYYVKISNSIATDLTLSSDTLSSDNFTEVQDNFLLNKNFSISPNPATDHISVHLKNSDQQVYSFEITDFNGKILLQKNIEYGKNMQDVRVNISAFAHGNYVFVLKSKNAVAGKQFLKQ